MYLFQITCIHGAPIFYQCYFFILPAGCSMVKHIAIDEGLDSIPWPVGHEYDEHFDF